MNQKSMSRWSQGVAVKCLQHEEKEKIFIFNKTDTCGAVAERLRRQAQNQEVSGSKPRSDISIEVTSQC